MNTRHHSQMAQTHTGFLTRVPDFSYLIAHTGVV